VFIGESRLVGKRSLQKRNSSAHQAGIAPPPARTQVNERTAFIERIA
jgi:hypothetical protein